MQSLKGSSHTLYESAQTVKISIVAVKLAASVDDSINGADLTGKGVNTMEIRYDRLLIGNSNIDSFKVQAPLCFDVYNKKIKLDGYCITITQPEHNSLRVVEVPKDGKEIVRKMSVHEQFRLMGFRISRDLKECEINFDGQSYTQLSKRAGNGWDVNLVGRLLTHIFKQL